MKKNLILLAAAFLAGATTLFAQDTLHVNGHAQIDSMLVVGDTAHMRGDMTVDGATTLRGEVTAKEFTVTENALFKGNMTVEGHILYPNVPATSGDFGDKEILVFDPASGGLEKSGVGAIGEQIYSKHCSAIGGIVTAPVWNNGPNKLYVACPEVRVGIGTENPDASLHVVGPGLFQSSVQAATAGVGGEPSTFSRFRVTNTNYGAAIEANNTGNDHEFNKLVFLQYDHPSTELIKVVNTATGTVPFFLEANGRMTIHNGTQKIFQLNPNGILQARVVTVDAYAWPDYVFEPGYDLRPLSEVRSFIQSNGHLPHFPSAKEIEGGGLNIGEVQKITTRSVEELYQYIFQLEDRIKELEALESRIKALEAAKQ